MRIRDENKVQAICETAIEMIVKKGFDGLSMQKLAKVAGVSPATIYIYFKDRDDLIYQITAEEGRKMTAAMLKDFDPEMGFAEGLRVQWLNRANHSLHNPLSMQFLEQIRFSPYHDRHKPDESFIKAMHQFVSKAIERKELTKLSIEVFWSVAYAPLYQLLKFHYSPKSLGGRAKFVFSEKTMDDALRVVLKGLKP